MRSIFCSPCMLEPQAATHARDMFVVLSDPAIYEFENEPPPSEEWLRNRFRLLESRRSADGREQWLNWVIRLPGGGLAGYVQATVLENHSAFVAYELHSRHWRRGIGSCAVRAMLQELHARYEVTDFIAVLKAANYRSKGLLEKLGFAAASPEQQALYRDEPDELVMLQSARGVAPASCSTRCGSPTEDRAGGLRQGERGELHATDAESTTRTALLGVLQSLEAELHHPGVRCDRARLEQLLHPEFHEVGRSGRAYDRETVIRHLSEQGSASSIASDSFAVAALASGVALLTYRSAHLEPGEGLGHHTLRSSVWVETEAGWQLRHHQGTAAAQTW
jgi:ribosomal-protein-alanine N-acetyltransferase